MLIAPCDCRLSRDAAMSCPRESRGRLVWSPYRAIEGQPVGPGVMESLDGSRERLTFGGKGDEWSENLARDHAAIRHLEFVVS